MLAAVLATGAHGASSQPRPSPKPEPLVVKVDGGSVRWSDAGIGAVAGFGIALVLVGVISLRRTRRAQGREQPAMTADLTEEER